MVSRHAAPRTCRRCGTSYTVWAPSDLAGHRVGICDRCRTPAARASAILRYYDHAPRMPDLSGGLCWGAGDDTWFPPDTDPVAVGRAKTICAGCPIRLECLAFAIRADERHGVWGGLTYRERTQLCATR